MGSGSRSRTRIKSRTALRRIVSRLKREGRTVVFTNGCFDLIHPGHIESFEKARAKGDVLIVAINSDASLRRLKGPNRPLVPQEDRAAVLAALACVDYVTVFDEDTPYELLKALRPNILVKGGDYRLDQIVGRDLVDRVVRVPLVPGRSTTALIERIVDRYGKA